MTAFPSVRRELERLGVTVDPQAFERFAQYRDMLLTANESFNLTRIIHPEEVESRILAESLTLLQFIPPDAQRLLDIGSGGGVPGIPLAIARPETSVVLLDATAKKVRFLADVASRLELRNVTAVHARAEELARERSHRHAYDVVTARAVARLVTLSELALPFLRQGGVAMFPKGQAAGDELAEARYAVSMLGGKARPVEVIGDGDTSVVIIDQRRPAADAFPRRTGVPNKTPLVGPGTTTTL